MQTIDNNKTWSSVSNSSLDFGGGFCSCSSCCCCDRGKTKSTPSPKTEVWTLDLGLEFDNDAFVLYMGYDFALFQAMVKNQKTGGVTACLIHKYFFWILWKDYISRKYFPVLYTTWFMCPLFPLKEFDMSLANLNTWQTYSYRGNINHVARFSGSY